ncbi:DVU3141 family protein [Neoroseomonas terrae]|uniref:DVU3141 family protein n=1 Tax=Neoroseomonas terrae TaxID=424799 RepID=UPI0030B9ECEC
MVAFAASAGAGAEETVTLPSTGQTVRLRLVRAYAAASGRECREVQMGTGSGSSSRLLCSAGTGWREARPLLRGGATGMP